MGTWQRGSACCIVAERIYVTLLEPSSLLTSWTVEVNATNKSLKLYVKQGGPQSPLCDPQWASVMQKPVCS